jgi:hypothetical protein
MINANANDNVGVTQLQCVVDGRVVYTTNRSSASCYWNTISASKGAHTISAKAQDAAGNVATKNIQVTVIR